MDLEEKNETHAVYRTVKKHTIYSIVKIVICRTYIFISVCYYSSLIRDKVQEKKYKTLVTLSNLGTEVLWNFYIYT